MFCRPGAIFKLYNLTNNQHINNSRQRWYVLVRFYSPRILHKSTIFPNFLTVKLTLPQADKLRAQQQLEQLQSRYIGTGHADTTKFEPAARAAYAQENLSLDQVRLISGIPERRFQSEALGLILKHQGDL